MTTTTTPHDDVIPTDDAALIGEFVAFLQAASARRYPSGTMKRFNQGRATAFVQAEFAVPDGLPDAHRVGLFAAPRTYQAWIRFANASSDTDRERDIRGMSIQVTGVPGENLTPGATTQDFVLNSHPVMLAPDTRGFLELLRANEAGGFRRIFYFLTHPAAARIGAAARQHHSSHLDIPYWSTTPYQFGPGRFVKYAVRPTSSRASIAPTMPTETYLTDAMREHLAQHEATFEFLIQFFTDDRRTPIEDASVEWKERDAPYHRVATIRIPPQSFDQPDRVASGEQIRFNPWHCLPDHRPVGGMNQARREIYRAMSEFRLRPRS
jgi:hypothetical protein